MFYQLTAAVRRNRKWFLVLAGVIVFITTYALILPAITIDKDTAVDEPGLEVVLQDGETTEENEAPPEDTTDAEEPETTEAELPPVVLEETSGDVSVKIEAEAGVFPADTTLVLNEVEDKQSLDSIEEAVDDAVADVQAVEIAFENADGEPVQPQNSFTLTVEPAAPEEEAQQVIVTLDESGEATVAQPEADTATQLVVEPDDVPVVALVETEVLHTTLLSASGKTYEATVTYDSTAELPEGAHLVLKEIKESSKDYREAKQVLENAGIIGASETSSSNGSSTQTVTLNEKELCIHPLQFLAIGGGFKTFMPGSDDANVKIDVLDLSIVDAKGHEIEPAAAVQVEITMKALPQDVEQNDFLSSAKVTHLRETGEGVRPEVVASNLAGNPGTIAVENGEAVMSFETDSFSQYAVSWTNESGNSRTIQVHYGYYPSGTPTASNFNPNNFVEFTTSQFSHGQPNIVTDEGEPNFLIYDVEGYEYLCTFRRSSSNTQIQPYLYLDDDDGIAYRYYDYDEVSDYDDDGDSTGHGMSNGNNVYVVYKPKPSIPQGGTALPSQYGDTPDEPEILKESKNNHDGTRTLSLSITGHETPLLVDKLADVILVFDVSGSMNDDMDGEDTDDPDKSRLAQAKRAINSLVDDLLGDDMVNANNQKLVRMALITFSNRAQIEQGFTSDPNVYKNVVNNMTAGGGTNWEDALKLANEMAVDPDRNTYVVFVSDGNPTYRMTRYNVSDATLLDDKDMYTKSSSENMKYIRYRMLGVFGKGSSDPMDRDYDAALEVAQDIVGHNKNFYTIGISNDVDRMVQLTVEAGSGADHSYTADTEDQFKAALDDIKTEMIGSLGWGEVGMVDGITAMTDLVAKTHAAGVHEDSFTYTKTVNGVETPWDPTSEGANEATYNETTGAVEWNMGETFQLEDGVTYTVSFRVWPSQEATDIVTELNNHNITYDSLTPAQKAQIQEVGGFYIVKTNTEDAYVTYHSARTIGGETTVSPDPEDPLYFQEVEPLLVNTMPFSIKKTFTDDLTEAEDRQDHVVMVLERRVADDENAPWETIPISYQQETPNGPLLTNQTEILLSDANKWSATFFISPGLTDAEGDTCNPGYVYRLTEPDIDYHYELNSEEVTPMFFGFSSLQEANASTEGDLINDLATEKDVYIREQYVGDDDHDKALTADNLVKSGIDLRKYVVDAAGNEDLSPDEEFTIHGRILDPDGNGYTFDPSWDDRTDVSTGTGASQIWKDHQNDSGAFHVYDKEGHRVGYKMHVADTSNFTLTLKSGERIRFINVPQDSTYAFWEDDGDMPETYSFVSVEGYNLTRDEAGQYITFEPDPYPTISTDGRTISDTIQGNAQYNVIFKNRQVVPNRIVVSKTVIKNDGETVTYPDQPFTIKGYVNSRVGDPFTIEDGNPLTYNIVDKDGNYVVQGAQFPTSYTFTVTLRGGDRLEILDVPNLSSYMIWELTEELDGPDSNFEYVSISGEAVSTTGGTPTQPQTMISMGNHECVSGTTHEGEEHAVVVTNKMLHDYVGLQVQKVDATNNELRLNGAKFQLFTDEDCEQPATDYNGDPIGDIVTGGFADDQQTQPLGIGSVGSLLPGTYYLVEIEAPPGYNVPDDPVIPVTISETGTVTVLQPDNAAGNTTVTAIDGIATIVVTNSQGIELPHTGGPGTFLYTSGGLLMMAAAMIYLICVRRRERRLE